MKKFIWKSWELLHSERGEAEERSFWTRNASEHFGVFAAGAVS